MNIKPPAITLHLNGMIHISASVRKTLGNRVLFYVRESGLEVVAAGKFGGLLFYDNGCCCFVPLIQTLGIKKKTRIPLTQHTDKKWIGELK